MANTNRTSNGWDSGMRESTVNKAIGSYAAGASGSQLVAFFKLLSILSIKSAGAGGLFPGHSHSHGRGLFESEDHVYRLRHAHGDEHQRIASAWRVAGGWIGVGARIIGLQADRSGQVFQAAGRHRSRPEHGFTDAACHEIRAAAGILEGIDGQLCFNLVTLAGGKRRR